MNRWRLLLNLIPALRHLLSAQTRVGDRDYVGALAQLDDLAGCLGLQFPSPKLPWRANLIGVQSAYFLRDGSLAETCARVVVDQLNKEAGRKVDAQLAYSADYMVRLMEHCGGRFSDQESVFLALAAKIEAADTAYDLSVIPERLRCYMPLPTLRQ